VKELVKKPQQVVALINNGQDVMRAAVEFAKANSKKLLLRLIVVYPVLIGSIYFTFIASDQYITTVHFTVNASDDKPQTDMLSAMTGIPGQSGSLRDVFAVKEFIESQAAIEQTHKYFDIKKLYASSSADWVSRLSSDASKEDVLEFWQDMVHVEFDALSGIGVLSIAAFEPDQAVLVADSLLKASEQLVNELSEQARQDTLKIARDELQRSEKRLAAARHAVREFRDREKSIDPEQSATAKLTVVTGLEGDLAKAEAQLNDLLVSMNANTPKVRAAQNLVDALRAQIRKERARWAKTTPEDKKNVSQLVFDYEQLLTEQGFAQTAHESALASMEQARMDASRKHKYLTVIARPYLPEEALKPERFIAILTLTIGCFMVWGIISLIIAAVKDHAGWV
jgi:capsular polysaccharide transport system permease protein